MLQIYIELLYLLQQRGTDVRLLRWSSISEAGVLVTPTKTQKSSGKRVLLPMTAAIKEPLDRAKALPSVKSEYVLHDRKGRAYAQATLKSRFDLVCDRPGYKGLTFKDIRAKTATDAFDQGYKEEEIQTALVHTDAASTRIYLRRRIVEQSPIRMELPSKRKPKEPADAGDGEK